MTNIKQSPNNTVIHVNSHNFYSHLRRRILLPLQLGPPFPNDVGILKPRVGLGLNQVEIDLRKVFLEKYNFFMN